MTGAEMRAAREAKGLSRDQLAAASRVSRNTIVRYEAGKPRKPDNERKLLAALGQSGAVPSPFATLDLAASRATTAALSAVMYVCDMPGDPLSRIQAIRAIAIAHAMTHAMLITKERK